MVNRLYGMKMIAREEALAVEYLHWAWLYSKNPLVLEEFTPDGSSETVEFKGVFDMVKHKVTLEKIKKELDMSWTVLRRHTKGLKEKEFFTSTGFNKVFADVMKDSIMLNIVYVTGS